MIALPIYDGQSLVDVSIKQYGTIEGIINLLRSNGIALDAIITDDFKTLQVDTTISFKPVIGFISQLNNNSAEGIFITDGQNIVDVTIQEYGSIEGVVKMCRDNSLSISQVLTSGKSLVIDASGIKRKQLIAYLKKNGVRVNTGLTKQASAVTHRIFDFSFDFTFE